MTYPSYPNPNDPSATTSQGAPVPQQTPPQAPTAPQQWGNYMMPYVVPSYQMVERVEKEVNQLALLAMIFSIVGFPFLFTAPRTADFPFFSVLISLIAVVTGHVSLSRKPSSTEVGRGTAMAITGLVIGYFLLSISLVWTLLHFTPVATSTTY